MENTLYLTWVKSSHSAQLRHWRQGDTTHLAPLKWPHCNLDIAEYFLQTNLGTTSTDFPQIKQAFYLVPRGLLKRDAEVSNIKAEQFQCDQNMFKIFRALISEKV